MEDQISNRKHTVKITQLEEQNQKRILKHVNSLRHHWENIKHTNIHITGVSEGEEREKGKKT